MTTPENADRQETDDPGFSERSPAVSRKHLYERAAAILGEAAAQALAEGAVRACLHGAGASALLAAGVVFTLNNQKPKYVKPGDLLKLPASLVVAPPPVTEQAFRVSVYLRKFTKDTVRANRIATALIREGGKRNLDPALLVGLLIAENAKLDPYARSNVSARGIMQVMPFHAGKWKQCPSRDLADIDSNICYGTSILADMVKRSPIDAAGPASIQRVRAGHQYSALPHVFRQGDEVRRPGRLCHASGSASDWTWPRHESSSCRRPDHK